MELSFPPCLIHHLESRKVACPGRLVDQWPGRLHLPEAESAGTEVVEKLGRGIAQAEGLFKGLLSFGVTGQVTQAEAELVEGLSRKAGS